MDRSSIVVSEHYSLFKYAEACKELFQGPINNIRGSTSYLFKLFFNVSLYIKISE